MIQPRFFPRLAEVSIGPPERTAVSLQEETRVACGFRINLRPKPGSVMADGSVIDVEGVMRSAGHAFVPADYGCSLKYTLARAQALTEAGWRYVERHYWFLFVRQPLRHHDDRITMLVRAPAVRGSGFPA